MSVSTNILSPDFLRARGVQITQALGDWLNRAMFIARTRQSQEDRERYQHWALCLIEDAIQAGGVGLKDWSKQSPTMPPSAESRTPKLLSSAPHAAPTATSSVSTTVRTNAAGHLLSPQNAKDRLLSECSQRCPVELRPFLQRAIDALDQNGLMSVHRGQHTNSISFLQVLHEAERLKGAHLQQQVAQQRLQFADAPPLYADAYASQGHVGNSSNYIVPVANHSTTGYAATTRTQLNVPPMYATGGVYTHTAPPVYNAMPAPLYAAVTFPPPETVEVSRPSKRHREPLEMDGDRRLKEQTRIAFAKIGCDSPSERRQSGFVGRSSALERQYSRDEPTPDDIRPLRTLKKAFAYIKTESASRGRKYFAEQLKGMRQDIRVQDIRSALSVEVYETSARVCLDTGDLGDFNKCQSALKSLYRHLPTARDNAAEFCWYRLAYLAFGGQFDALALELMDDSLPNDAFDGAAAICTAIQDGEGNAVVGEVMKSPATHMKSLAQLFLQRHRVMWLGSITGSMRGKLTSKYLLRTLGYSAYRYSAAHSQSTGADTPEGHPDWFIDGSFDLAVAGFASLLDVLKVQRPEGLDAAADLRALFAEDAPIVRSKKKRPQATLAQSVPTAVWDAQELNAAVVAYNQFLTTRRDAAGVSEA